MKTIITAVMATALSTSMLLAAPFTIQTDDEVLFIRCTDMFGTASCEAIYPDLNAVYRCIALDEGGKPLAVTAAIGGTLVYAGLNASLVTDIKCRK